MTMIMDNQMQIPKVSILIPVYKVPEKFLRQCLDSVTPCQIAGLLNHMGKANDNLYCVDVVCRAVPSPMAFPFLKALLEKPADAVYAAYFPKTLTVRLEKAARLTCHRLGIYWLAKKAYLKVIGFQR